MANLPADDLDPQPPPPEDDMGFSSFHLYFDDLELGQEWDSPGRTVTESDIVTFAGFSGDFNPMHVDHEYAATTPFRRPIAHGFGIFSIASGLGVMIPPVRTVALLAVVHWRFLHPVFVGDTITVRTRVNQKTHPRPGPPGRSGLVQGDPSIRTGRSYTRGKF